MVNNILDQTTKAEFSKYFHADIFIPTKTRLLKLIKQGFLNTWPGLTEGLIKIQL